MAINTTRYPNGITTSISTETYGNFLIPDATKVITYFDDFSMHSDIMLTVPTSHNITSTGTFTRAFTGIGGTPGGFGLFSTGATSGNGGFIQHKSTSFMFQPNKSYVMKVRFKTNSIANANIFLGLSSTVFDPNDYADVIGFSKAAGSGDIFAAVVNNQTGTLLGEDTIASDTFVTLGLRYNGNTRATDFLINELLVDTVSGTSIYHTNQVMTPTISLFTAAASAATLTLDLIEIQFER
jgi:hypothetical protein